MVNLVSQSSNKSLEAALNSVTQMCQQMCANLEIQNYLITALQDKYKAQQKLATNQGRQIELLNRKLDCITYIVLDRFQEANEDIGESEYKGDGDSANQSTQHNSPWDMEEGKDTADSKKEVQHEDVEPTQEVGKHPPLPKRAPTKSGTPPCRTPMPQLY